MPAQGTYAAGRMRNKFSKTTETAEDEFRTAYDALNVDGKVTVKDMMEYLGVIDKTIYARIRKMSGEFVLKKGQIYRAADVSIIPENGAKK